MDINKTGEFLAALRKSQGYTQKEVADYLNISNKTVSKWEQGGGYPDLTILPVLAEFYHVTVDEILAGEKTNRQTEPDHQRGAALRRHLLGKIQLHFDLCFAGTLLLVLLAGLFAYTIWCMLFNILAGGMLLVGVLVSGYEVRSADEALEDRERTGLSRSMGQKAFLAIGLILWSSLFMVSLVQEPQEPLWSAVLRSHLWAAACTAVMAALWMFGNKRWGVFLDRTSGLLCGTGLVILNLSAPVTGYQQLILRSWLMELDCRNAILLSHRIILLIHFIAVVLIVVGVVRQLVRDRRKARKEEDPSQAAL